MAKKETEAEGMAAKKETEAEGMAAKKETEEEGTAEAEVNAAPESAVTPAQFQLQKIYAKDVSFELPNAPEVFQESGKAEIKMNLSQQVNNISDEIFEVILTVTVTSMTGEKTAYLAEVHQAGLFLLQGFNEQNHHTVLNTLCPHALFPYACRIITNLVGDGGFPPLVLQPINFEQVYAQRMAAAKEQSGDAENPEVQGIA